MLIWFKLLHGKTITKQKSFLREAFEWWTQVDVTRTDFDIISEFLLQLIAIDNNL